MSDVVVGVDDTGRSLRALMWAAHEARLRGTGLRIVHTLPRYEMDMPFFPPGRFEEAETRARAIVRESVAVVEQISPGLPCTAVTPMSTPAVAVIEESQVAQLVVLGGKGDTLSNLLLGSTALQVVGHARCPVVVVAHVSAGHDRVVVGTDGSPDAAAALAHAFASAARRGAELLVVAALGLPQGWPRHLLRPLPEDDEEVTARRLALEQQIAPLVEQHHDVKVVLRVHHEAPIEALESASGHGDLLVLGSRGLGGFHGLAVGSVTHTMLHLATCPVVVVPTDPAVAQAPGPTPSGATAAAAR